MLYHTKMIPVFLFFFFSLLVLNCNESDKYKKFEMEKITFQTEQKFDQFYPVPIKEFRFNQGENNFRFKEFLKITQDPALLKNQEMLKKTRIAGFTSMGVIGATMISFIIPSGIFLSERTGFFVKPGPYEYAGIAMIVLSLVSAAALIVNIFATVMLLYHYRYNEKTVREAVERYNEKLLKTIGIIPDIGLDSQKNVNLSLQIKL